VCFIVDKCAQGGATKHTHTEAPPNTHAQGTTRGVKVRERLNALETTTPSKQSGVPFFSA
jgi:hypothetical protein